MRGLFPRKLNFDVVEPCGAANEPADGFAIVIFAATRLILSTSFGL